MASSPTRNKWRGGAVSKCESHKVSYDTRDEALDAAERLMAQGRVKRGCHLTPYLCDECATWHIFNRTIVFVDDPYRRARDLRDD